MRAGDAGGTSAGTLPGVVRDVAFRGTGFSCRIELPALGAQVKAEGRGATPPFAVDDAVGIDWSAESCWLLPRERGDDTPPPPPASEPESDPAEARA